MEGGVMVMDGHRVGLLDPQERIVWPRAMWRLFCLGWALAMGLLGVMMMMGTGPGLLPLGSGGAFILGIAGLAGGWFVFLVLVADAWFPHAARRLVVPAEVFALAVFLCSLALAVARLV
jgi:hypothetical protein